MRYHAVRVVLMALLAALNAVAIPLDLASSTIGVGTPREYYYLPPEDR